MKKYKVNVNRIEYGFVEVEAEDEQEASDKASALEEDGMVNWMNSEINIMEIEEIK